MNNTRYISTKIIELVSSGERLDSALNAAHDLPERERRLAAAIAICAVRHRFLIEKHLARYMKKPFTARERNPARRRAYALLLAGAAQLLYMEIPAHAAVGETMAAADKNPFKKLINGVLRSLERGIASSENPDDNPTDALPDWLRENLFTAYGETRVQILATQILRPPPLDICFKGEVEAARFSAAYDKECATIAPNMLRLTNAGEITALPFYEEGDWWVQDIAATLPARILLSLYKNDGDILDLCAAPGGKSLQLANALMNQKSKNKLISIDSDKKRLKILQDNLTRTQLSSEIIAADILDWQTKNKFSYILLDAPCSASGTLRRNPDILWHRRAGDIAAAQETQKALLAKAASLLADNGSLIYCVCSLLPQEGEQVVSDFLQANKGFAAETIQPLLGFTQNSEFGLTTINNTSSRLECDGFFIARLRKKA